VDAIASELQAELEASRAEFHQLLALASGDAWRSRSANPAWTNGQLLFHIALGFFLVGPLVLVMRIFAALPPSASKLFAMALNAATPLFNRINALGPRLAVLIFNASRLGRTFDAVARMNLKRVASLRPDDWRRGMHYPERWEPRFDRFMTFESLFHYPTIHLRHHRQQLALSGIEIAARQ
jgi:hypothetical protein